MAAEIDSPLLRAIRRAFTPVTAASLQTAVPVPAPVAPARIWIVWRRMPFGGARVIELVTASEQRALRLAASDTYLVADQLDVEDAAGCPGWCPNRDVPS